MISILIRHRLNAGKRWVISLFHNKLKEFMSSGVSVRAQQVNGLQHASSVNESQYLTT
jgi:hypothetical protein